MAFSHAALPLLVLLAAARLLLTDGTAAAGSPARGGGRHDLERAEQVLSRLEEMAEAAAERDGRRALRNVYGKFYPGLFVRVAELGDSDLKTELDTAVFLFERLSRDWLKLESANADCRWQRSDTYLPLCLGLRGGSDLELLLAKANLHTRWARALARRARGAADAETAELLRGLRRARANDLSIAAGALEACRGLGELLRPRAAAGELSEGLAQRDIEDAQLRRRYALLVADADLHAAALPRSPLRYRIMAALSAYRDGLFWLDEVSRRTGRVVSLAETAARSADRLRLPPESARAALSANLAQAKSYTAKAEAALLEARRQLQSSDFAR